MTHAGRITDGSLLAPLPRSDETELLDAVSHDAAELSRNFRDIERVNRLLGGTATVLRHLPRLIPPDPAAPVTMLDLATGSADIPLAVARWASKRGIPVEITASDISDDILTIARRATTGHPEITVTRLDARAVALPDDAVDIVLCSLSLHHFDPDGAVEVLREMDRVARHGFILNDLRRGRLGWIAAWVAARLTTRNRLTRNDAPLSVRRAYTPGELETLLRRAGVEGASITTHSWFRMAAVKGAAR